MLSVLEFRVLVARRLGQFRRTGAPQDHELGWCRQFGSSPPSDSPARRRLLGPPCFLRPPGFQMCHLIDAVFNSPTNPTAILFLVEDTDLMTSLQHSLRDSYLLMILEAVYKNKSLGLVGSPRTIRSRLSSVRVPRPKHCGCPPPISFH